jgi:pyrimidine-nucleoside phosphorylase
MRAVDIIRAKRDGQALSREAIETFVGGVTTGAWPDYQASALLMAIVLKGMSAEETGDLTRAMAASGRRIDLSALPGTKVGKHSTGGVGDKVSIVLAPLAAACGVIVPKMSGRGLGHTGGTLDKLEAIPGFRTALSLDEFLAALADVGCAIISQTADVAPADKKLYALRDVTATVESLPLICASVMSKKIAEGSDALVLDVKAGRGAFMKSVDQALELARALVSIGEAAGLKTEAFVTRMDAPLGRSVGNALEIAECVDLAHGRGPADVRELIVRLGGRMVMAGGRAASSGEAERQVRDALASGAAADRLRRMIAAQHGDPLIVDSPERLPRARCVRTVVADRSGIVTALDAEAIGRTAVLLGAGRERKDDPVDPAAGVRLVRTVGEPVRAGEAILELHGGDNRVTDDAMRLAAAAVAVADAPPDEAPLVQAWVHAAGEERLA